MSWAPALGAIDSLANKGGEMIQLKRFLLPDIFQAAQQGRMRTVKSFLQKGTPVDVRDGSGRTPLMHAAEEGRPQMVQFLLDSGADPNAEDDTQFTPLGLAVHYSHNLECVRLLIDHGADVNAQDDEGFSILMLAVDDAPLELIKMLVEAGADVNHQDCEGDTPLIVAMDGFSSAQEIQYLLDSGADKTIRNNAGKCAYDVLYEDDDSFHGPEILELVRL
ncbi:Ankyrin repeat [Desulfatibacillum alkenivorans DSM 16219]|uniref:Ankyrin repeat n=2 Tax=Desulfatibacillum alkenivorans TaxID=259354 RepID=A0A1M6J8D2_9BACT|nr:Ankyrin repeat [Desulfatibacillum alkenivorans DSM 16219]